MSKTKKSKITDQDIAKLRRAMVKLLDYAIANSSMKMCHAVERADKAVREVVFS